MPKRTPARDWSWFAWMAALGELLRLRAVRLLEHEELSVGELARILQLPQSTMSRHLKPLFDGALIAKRSVGTTTLYRFDPKRLPPAAAQLWAVAGPQVPDEVVHDDQERLKGVLAERRTDSRAFFGRVGGEWDSMRRELFGSAFSGDALLGIIDPDWTIADLGCGTGDAAERLAPLVKKVIGVDREPAMLEAGRKRLAGSKNVEFREGDLLSLPLKGGEVDAAVIMLVLHHIAHPADAMKECSRVLAARGRILVVDMVKHDRQAYARTMGHLHLGFAESETAAWAKSAGLRLRRYSRLRPDPSGKGPALFTALFSR